MTSESGWTAEALDYALQHNLEQQGEVAGDLLNLDQVPFGQRVNDLIDQLDTLQAQFVKLNRIEPMR